MKKLKFKKLKFWKIKNLETKKFKFFKKLKMLFVLKYQKLRKFKI